MDLAAFPYSLRWAPSYRAEYPQNTPVADWASGDESAASASREFRFGLRDRVWVRVISIERRRCGFPEFGGQNASYL